MRTVLALMNRNRKLFFKDKGMLFTSMITPVILIVLYATFLAKVFRDSFTAAIPDVITISDKLINGTDVNWLVASIHNLGLPGLENPTVEKCTQLWLNIAHDPKVNVIGHSGSPEFRYDYETVIPEFGRNHKLVEINAHSFEVRKANIPNCREIALCCKKHRVPIIVSSDAHFETQVKDHTAALEMLREIAFPEELILNANTNRLIEYLRAHTNILENRKDADAILRSFENV